MLLQRLTEYASQRRRHPSAPLLPLPVRPVGYPAAGGRDTGGAHAAGPIR